MMFSLVLLSATSSKAQTESEDQGNSARAAVGDEECVEFEDENNDTLQSQQDDDEGSGNSQSQQDALDNEADEESRDGDPDVQDQSENGDLQGQDEDEDDDALPSEQDGEEDEGEQQASQQDVNEEDDGLQDLQDGEDDTTSSQAEEAEDEECVVADTVPDESLLPTGAPASSSPTDEKTAEKESDRDGEQQSRKGTTQGKTTNGEARKKSNDTGKQQKVTNSGTQKKTGDGSRQKKTSGGEAKSKSNRSETRNVSGSVGTTQGKSNGSEALKKSGGGETVRVRGTELEVDDRAGKEPLQEELKARAQFAAASDLAPRLAATEWTRPAREEIASTGKPRNFAPDPNAQMTFSARALGLYDMPVASSERLEDLDTGLVHVPETSRPWDEGGQKNVFIAGHYLGTPQTLSRLAFYNLHKLKSGDELVLEDGRGQAYKYRVSEKFAVEAGDSWAMGEVRDRDMVTLQTCIPPDFGKRLMVRADRVRD
jgi:LPXTG-site transpeptidase (sortase) family protein